MARPSLSLRAASLPYFLSVHSHISHPVTCSCTPLFRYITPLLGFCTLPVALLLPCTPPGVMAQSTVTAALMAASALANAQAAKLSGSPDSGQPGAGLDQGCA